MGNVGRRRFPWIPAATVSLVMAGVAWVQLQPELERNLKAWVTAALPLLGGLVVLGWFALSRRFAARVRWAGVVVVLVVPQVAIVKEVRQVVLVVVMMLALAVVVQVVEDLMDLHLVLEDLVEMVFH